jgi:hypothetical protein
MLVFLNFFDIVEYIEINQYDLKQFVEDKLG